MQPVSRAIIVTGVFLFSLLCIFFLLGGVGEMLQPSQSQSFEAGLVLTIFSSVALASCVLALISIMRIENRYLDTDGDGLGGDGLKASQEQKRLITNGFRDLGIFYEPKKRSYQGASARNTQRA